MHTSIWKHVYSIVASTDIHSNESPTQIRPEKSTQIRTDAIHIVSNIDIYIQDEYLHAVARDILFEAVEGGSRRSHEALQQQVLSPCTQEIL